MSVDLKVVYVRDVVKIKRATLISKDPPTLQLYGSDFSHADTAVINGIETVDFVILNKTAMNVVVPVGARSGVLRTIDVLSGSFTATEKSYLEMRLGMMPQWTSGIHKLTQQFVKVLLTTPGTSLFRPDEGGGLQEMVGSAFSREEARVIASRAMLAVNRTTDQVKASQSRRGIPKAERLQTAVIEDVAFDPQTGGLNLKVLLRSEAGHITIANMGLSNAPAIGSGNMLPASAAGSA